jgi:hypothetical protein
MNRARGAMASSGQLSYQLLKSAADPSFEQFFRIYAESIHAREQKPKELIAKMVARRDYKIFLQKLDGDVTGFSIMFAPPGEDFCLLEYMAVDSSRRNTGLGGRLFLHTTQAMGTPGGAPLPMLLEVDSDREPSPDQQMRKRRLEFYKRLGCLRVAALPYILPLVGTGAVPEMFLLVHAPAEARFIPKSQLRHWLAVIYEKVYSCPPNDPRIARMLEGVSDPAGLK